jgi:hypothetical protein
VLVLLNFPPHKVMIQATGKRAYHGNPPILVSKLVAEESAKSDVRSQVGFAVSSTLRDVGVVVTDVSATLQHGELRGGKGRSNG